MEMEINSCAKKVLKFILVTIFQNDIINSFNENA